MGEITTDYLVVGAGAAGMAFVDTLIAERDADVVMVDRRHAPGGHWNDSYPFVRLHQPAAFYGVDSTPLGRDRIDETGHNAGFYELATGAEICDYFQRVLGDTLLPSGRVRFLGGCDYQGDWMHEHALVRKDGARSVVRVRHRVVDTTYLDCSVPAAHTRSFTVDSDASVVAVGDLPSAFDTFRRYTVLGGGKTAMDACCWLLDNGVDPDRIRWLRPRDAWLLDRAFFQPLELVSKGVDGFSRSIEALAVARDMHEFWERVEHSGMFVRLDPRVEPTMFRGAIASESERTALRQIERIVRGGRVRHVGCDRICLDTGDVPTSHDEVHVDCTAYGLGSAPLRPTFEPGRITIQSAGQTTPAAATVAWIEANRDDDEERNRLMPPSATPSRPEDWVVMLCEYASRFAAHASEPDLLAWRERSRLNSLRGLADRASDPVVEAAMVRWVTNQDAALANAPRLLAPMTSSAQPHAAVAR